MRYIFAIHANVLFKKYMIINENHYVETKTSSSKCHFMTFDNTDVD